LTIVPEWVQWSDIKGKGNDKPRFLVFDMSREGKFDDGYGNNVSLEDHLFYLENYGGTPDCGILTDSLQEAVNDSACFQLAAIVDSERGHEVLELVGTEA
jgi:hypothetical protein